MSDKLKRGELYPIADLRSVPQNPAVRDGIKQMARWTGVTRPPMKGEWYLSGAIIEAYQAPNDLSTVFAIAEIVNVETKIIVTQTVAEDEKAA